MASTSALPEYAPLLAAYHRAYEPELRAMIARLPIEPGDHVLDLACGDGSFSCWLAERVGDAGSVVAADLSPAFLDTVRKQARRHPAGTRIECAQTDIGNLPFADDTFDLVWCAQSLYSLPDPVEALRAMARVVRPGGVVAVLEDDTMHQVLLPWPIEIELAVRRAELRGYVEESDQPRKFYIGRQLCAVFRAAGLVNCRKETGASNRQAPLGPDERAFLEAYLLDLKERATPFLDTRARAEFERLVEPGSGASLFDDPDLSVTCIDHLVRAEKPAIRAG